MRASVALGLATAALLAPDLAAAECVATVVEVRGADVYLTRAAECAVAVGTRIAGEGDDPVLVVQAVASGYILARLERGQVERGRRLALPEVATNGGAPEARRKFKAGPGVPQPSLPAEFFSEAAKRARAVRPATAASSHGPLGTGLIVHGGLGAGVIGVTDFSDRERGFWRVFADSRLALDRPGAVAIGYRHRIRWQRRMAYDLTSQPWDDDYPQWGVHEVRASFGFLDRRLDATVGRFAPDGVAGAAVVDGGEIEGEPLTGLRLGAYGGLLPHPTSLVPDARGTGFGAFIHGRGSPSGVAVGGSLLFAGSTWDGELDETHMDALLTVRPAAWLDVFLLSRLDAWIDHDPLSRPAVDLTRLNATARSRPVERVDVAVRYAFVRFIPNRRTDDLWGTDLSRNAGPPLSALGASVRYEPIDGLGLLAEGEADIDGPRGEGFWAGTAVSYDFRAGHGVAVRYRYNDADISRSHHASATGRLALHRTLDLSASYRFSLFLYDGSGDDVPEHDAALSIDWQPWRRVFAQAELDWIQGGDVSALVSTVHAGWRF